MNTNKLWSNFHHYFIIISFSVTAAMAAENQKSSVLGETAFSKASAATTNSPSAPGDIKLSPFAIRKLFNELNDQNYFPAEYLDCYYWHDKNEFFWVYIPRTNVLLRIADWNKDDPQSIGGWIPLACVDGLWKIKSDLAAKDNVSASRRNLTEEGAKECIVHCIFDGTYIMIP